MFAILVLMALFTTFMTTPIVLAIYKPARGIKDKTRRKLGDINSFNSRNEKFDTFRVLACIHGPNNIPSIISFIESSRSNKNSFLKLFMMHLVELSERTSSIIMAQRARKNGFPFFNRTHRDTWHDRLAGAFRGYSQLGRVKVKSTTAISSLSTMHEDICHVAQEKRVTMIVLPFHKQWRMQVGEDNETQHWVLDNVGHEWRLVNEKVLRNAPCSVAILVDRGYGNMDWASSPSSTVAQRVCIIFFGGPDDREALELGNKMLQHPAVKVRVVRFVEKDDGLKENNNVLSFSQEKELDEKAIEKFRSKLNEKVEYTEKVSEKIVEEVIEIGKSGDYDVIIVGKGRFPSNMVAGLAEKEAEHAELGPIGDVLTSSESQVVSSVLVIQQHDVALVDENHHDHDLSHTEGISTPNVDVV